MSWNSPQWIMTYVLIVSVASCSAVSEYAKHKYQYNQMREVVK